MCSTALLLGLAWGCAAADNADSDTPAGGGKGSIGGAGNDASVIITDGEAQDSGSLGFNPLCGEARGCVPDLPSSCGEFVAPVIPGEDASSSAGAANAQAGATGEGGSAGDHAGPAGANGAGEGGMSGAGGTSAAAGEAGSAGSVGAAGASGALTVTAPEYGCQVQRAPSAPREPFFSCALAGSGGENAPCLTARDCQAGLACVSNQGAGLCQKYCCQDANECEQGSYCAERPMRDSISNASSTGSDTLMIPVCVHAENCDLGTPYPCPAGRECACKSGTACLVVRADGTTTCAVPGAGKAGESCPCAWGHVCSAATNECLQLCYTRDSDTCGSGRCQAASELPEGWGVCVGGSPSGG